MRGVCDQLRADLAECLKKSDCMRVHGHSGHECLSQYRDTLPAECQQAYKGFVECKRSLWDMRKRYAYSLTQVPRYPWCRVQHKLDHVWRPGQALVRLIDTLGARRLWRRPRGLASADSAGGDGRRGPRGPTMLRASGRRASTIVHLSARRLQSTARPKSKHALLYSEIVPPVFRVLAYSTAAYFGMHLTWLALRNREESEAQAAELAQLRTEIQRAQTP